jgi:hypothetical protein
LDVWRVAKKFKSKAKHKEIKLVYADNDIVYVSIHSYTKFQNTTEKTERSQNLQIGVECLEDFKTKNQGARQTYCIQLDSVVCKEDSKRIPVCEIVICKTIGKLVYI